MTASLYRSSMAIENKTRLTESNLFTSLEDIKLAMCFQISYGISSMIEMELMFKEWLP